VLGDRLPTGQLTNRLPTGQLTNRPPTGQLTNRPPTGQLTNRPPTGQLTNRPPTGQPARTATPTHAPSPVVFRLRARSRERQLLPEIPKKTGPLPYRAGHAPIASNPC
jgi:hypothetical protein